MTAIRPEWARCKTANVTVGLRGDKGPSMTVTVDRMPSIRDGVLELAAGLSLTLIPLDLISCIVVKGIES